MGLSCGSDDLSDIMEESCFLGEYGIESEFGGDSFRDLSDFYAMRSEILPITVSQEILSDHLHKFWFHHRDIKHSKSLLTLLDEKILKISDDLVIGLFDVERIDPSILDEFLKHGGCDISLFTIE